jgi:adenylate cyclase
VADRFRDLAAGALCEGARLVKTMGDQVMVVAPTPLAGARTGLEIAARVDAEPLFPGVRAGAHHGPVLERDGDYFGAVVNLASRVGGYARPGELLVTSVIAHAIRGEGSLSVISAGRPKPRNIAEPVPLFELADSRHQAADASTDPVCRMRVPCRRGAGMLIYQGRQFDFCSWACARTFTAQPERYI